MGGGGKGQPVDRSAELYAQQQADLARQRAEQQADEQRARDEEARLREELRANMLGQRNMLTTGGEEEEADILQTTLG